MIQETLENLNAELKKEHNEYRGVLKLHYAIILLDITSKKTVF